MAKQSNAIHFVVGAEMKKKILDYCVRNDITISQFQRWASSHYINHFPTTPMPIGEQKNEKKK